jgi:xanthine dehydrogenase small subunit
MAMDIRGMSHAPTSTPVEFLLNGRPVSVEAGACHTTLLDFLRARGLTGAKEGCAEGECGACAVALVTEHGAAASVYRIVNSCLMPLPLAAHHEVYTVESLATGGQLAPAQEAMAEAGGSQCVYCTPGFVMSLFAEQYRPGRNGPCDPLALAGNLCRCTGYRPIRDAALGLGPPPPGALRDRLERPAPRIGAVASVGFSRPGTVDDCVAILAAHPDATLIAGGTDLGVESNLGGRRFAHLISLEAIDELRACSETSESVTLGAALPLSDIEQRWANAAQVFREWLALFASPLIRNRATLGGNLVTASPIGDGAPLLLALDAVVHAAGPEGRRTIPLSSFFVGYRRTALRPGEVLTAIEIPKPLPACVRFYKVAKRRLDDISTVAAAMAMDWERSGHVRRARFAFGGVAATPLRVVEAETAVVGQPWNQAAVERVQRILDRTLTPIGDHRGSKEYRLEVSKSLVEKFWSERPS